MFAKVFGNSKCLLVRIKNEKFMLKEGFLKVTTLVSVLTDKGRLLQSLSLRVRRRDNYTLGLLTANGCIYIKPHLQWFEETYVWLNGQPPFPEV